jgi:uncharacterized protein (TIGR00288 family)
MVKVPHISEVTSKLKGKHEKNIALFVDGPNLLRKEFNFDLAKLKQQVEKMGKISIAKVFLNQFAPQKLIEAVSSEGMEPVVTPVDCDVALATEVMEAVYNPNINIICIATRDGDYQPPIMKAKKHGKETVAFGVRQNISESLINSVDKFIEL